MQTSGKNKSTIDDTLSVRPLGLCDYMDAWRAMQLYTDQRPKQGGGDELWLLEHPAVFTQGQAGKAEHVLEPGDIPVIQVDRGGQVTYHGPGQLVAYLLINLAARGLGVRDMVSAIERSIIILLESYGIDATVRPKAPGVFVGQEKIASLGLRVRRGCTFHGFSLNVSVSKEHFSRINPCGFAGLEVCNLAELVNLEPAEQALPALNELLARTVATELGYNGTVLAEPILPLREAL